MISPPSELHERGATNRSGRRRRPWPKRPRTSPAADRKVSIARAAVKDAERQLRLAEEQRVAAPTA